MNKHLTLLLFIGLAWGQKQYNIEHIVKQGGVHKKKFSDEIVNGEVFKMVGDLKVPLGKMKSGIKPLVEVVRTEVIPFNKQNMVGIS